MGASYIKHTAHILPTRTFSHFVRIFPNGTHRVEKNKALGELESFLNFHLAGIVICE